MKVSSKTRYALKTVLDLAQHRHNSVCRVTEIASRQSIPQKFLEQILLSLKSAGIVMSKRGAKGGYFLARHPTEISVASVIRVTEENLLTTSSLGLEDDGENPFNPVWRELNAIVVNRLENLNLQQVCDIAEQARQTKAGDYTI